MAMNSKNQRHIANINELTKALKLSSKELFLIDNFGHNIPNNWTSKILDNYLILRDDRLQRCITWPVIMLGVFENKSNCMISVTLKQVKTNDRNVLKDSKKWWHESITTIHTNTIIETEKAQSSSNDLIVMKNLTLKSAIEWLYHSTKIIHEVGWTDIEIPKSICSSHTCKINNTNKYSKKTKPIWQPTKSYHYGYEKGLK